MDLYDIQKKVEAGETLGQEEFNYLSQIAQNRLDLSKNVLDGISKALKHSKNKATPLDKEQESVRFTPIKENPKTTEKTNTTVDTKVTSVILASKQREM